MKRSVALMGSAILPEGDHEAGAFSIESGIDEVTFQLDASQFLNPGTFVEWGAWISTDGGATYEYMAGGGRDGGIAMGDDGKPDLFLRGTLSLKEPEKTNRRLKIVIRCVRGSFTTGGGTLIIGRD